MLKGILLFFVFIIGIYGADINKVKIFTENYPPYNMEINGKLKGISVDILEAMLKQMHSKLTKKDIKLRPWATAYKIVSKKKNTMLFSTVKTKQRDKLFKWVGPISASDVSLIALQDSNIKISKTKDINNYKVGVVLHDVAQQVLSSNKISSNRIIPIAGKDAMVKNLKALLQHDIDLFACNFVGAKYSAKLHYIKSDLLKKIYTIKKSQLYFAFNKNTDDSVIKVYQKALDEIKANGTYDKILKKYK
jgi:polar amino acid transport system substrate-binding protein